MTVGYGLFMSCMSRVCLLQTLRGVCPRAVLVAQQEARRSLGLGDILGLRRARENAGRGESEYVM